MSVSDEEHWKMLSLLYRHGTNLKALHAAMPEWGQDKVEHYVKCVRTNSQRRLKQNEYGANGPSAWVEEFRTNKNPASVEKRKFILRKSQEQPMQHLSSWMTYVNNVQKVQGTANPRRPGRLRIRYCPLDHGPLLSKVLLFLSEKEEHPAPSSSSDPDYREIYRYLSQMIAGQEPTQLSQGSAAKVLEMIKRVEKVVWSRRDLRRLKHHLNVNQNSCLQPWKKKMDLDDPHKEKNKSGMSECPLFEDVDSDEDITNFDPHCQWKKEKLQKKCKKKQEETSIGLSNIPGVNPLLMPPHLTFKDLDMTMESFPEAEVPESLSTG